ncbi:unnamed protein product [Darwinula stevensoni]|uniref:Myotubularin phosphatase domain-containing protein n=1 Tax=Darwinula stevensoni TaxID=69355 RepID=A0A7R8X2M1_9CRUS|nr:unnamed protein product [Darwinula stevensoni]CAG0884097.1 unnamed protein product [Darwinula stevensoni]
MCSPMEDVTREKIHNLLGHFSKNLYRAKDSSQIAQEALQLSLSLMNRDYSCMVVGNASGELSAHYPSQLIVIEYEKANSQKSMWGESISSETIYESILDPTRVKDLISKARFARCRARFPVPVIFFQGRHICRSATLSGGPEIYGRSGLNFFFGKGSEEATDLETCDEIPVPQTQTEWQLFDKVRSHDIRLLKTLSVGTIVDLMLEKKKVKFGLYVTSSEKVDRENRYNDFVIISLPYPGCEFFSEFRDNGYNAESLKFDWNQNTVDVQLSLPQDSVAASLDIKWSQYKTWDLVQLTQSYLRLILRQLQEGQTGILLHCISGWDRTPLFISLIRLSLWADGHIHKSLSPLEILYLTLAYDWFLFGHDMADRLSRGEEVLFFTFYFLKFITGEDFVVTTRQRTPRLGYLRNDSDVLLDGGVLLDGDLKGSNTSLNSSSSSLSTRSQENPPLFFSASEEDPPCGSWQIISGTGSIRGSTSDSSSVHSRNSACGVCSEGQESIESCSTLVGDNSNSASISEHLFKRQECLNAVRSTFYQLYCSSVGFTFRNGPPEPAGFGTLLENFAERVGFRAAPRTCPP